MSRSGTESSWTLSAGGSWIRTLGPPPTVSSVHPGAHDTTHSARSEFHINAATQVRTCLAKAIEECRAPRDAACGHTRPGRAHRDKHRWWRDVALLRNEKQTARLAE